MGVQTSIANALLATLSGCVDCDCYERQFVTLGDPVIDCNTLAIGIQSFPVIAEVAGCQLAELRMTIVAAQCCVPLVGPKGEPPVEAELTKMAATMADEAEKLICCINSIDIEVPGVVKQCSPKFYGVTYGRPLGGCVSAKLDVRIKGVPCCAT